MSVYALVDYRSYALLGFLVEVAAAALGGRADEAGGGGGFVAAERGVRRPGVEALEGHSRVVIVVAGSLCVLAVY